MKHAATRELYDYWNRVRGNARAPHRGAIEPADIRRVLADTFILEVTDRETFGVRLAGTRVCAVFGRELKGSNFFNLWQEEDRAAMATLATAVTEDGAAAVVTLTGVNARDQELTAELLLLPLRTRGEAFDRVLGCLSVAERPYWLGADAVIHQRIASLRLLWPDRATDTHRPTTEVFRPQVDQASLAVSSPAFAQQLPNARRRAHLVVMDGGKA